VEENAHHNDKDQDKANYQPFTKTPPASPRCQIVIRFSFLPIAVYQNDEDDQTNQD
jgi:hypothetical protein